jgi:hypothetical protein
MLVNNRATGFQFNNELMTDEKIGGEIAKQSAVGVEDTERMLLNHLESLFSEPMIEAIFVDFLHVTMPEMPVERETSFTNLIAELEDGIFHGPPFLRLLRVFAAKKSQPVFLEPPIKRAAAQPEFLGGFARVAVAASERFFDQERLDLLDAHFLEPRRGGGGVEAEVGRA